MISHSEAQALISARLDQPLDPIAERELNAHLARCSSCRAFAQSSESLAMQLRELPYLPASSTVSRGVMARIEEGRSPWAKLGGLLNTNPGPALSTFAVVAVLFLLGFFVFTRFVLDSDTPDDTTEGQLASQPTAPPTQEAGFVIEETEEAATEAATETVAPTEEPTAAPTETAEPTEPATEAPTETAEPEPTATTAPEPTTTSEPEPTATTEPEPTATTEPQPTATTAPTEAPEEDVDGDDPEPMIATGEESTPDEIVDLTGDDGGTLAAESATATTEPTPDEPTPEPTATTEPTPEPTATEEPTPEPTATVEPTATATAEPTATATAEPTAPEEPTPEPTGEEAPPILPIDGSDPVDAPDDEPDEEETDLVEGQGAAGVAETPEDVDTGETGEDPAPTATELPIGGQEDDTGEITIEPIGTESPEAGDDVTGDGTEAASVAATATSVPEEETPEADDDAVGGIEPIEATGTDEDDTDEAEATATVAPQGGDIEANDLAAASQPYGGIAGDPSGRLILEDGRMEYGPQAHPSPLVTASGYEAQAVSTDTGQAVSVCTPWGDCGELSSLSREGAADDEPIGWLGGGVVYMRTQDGAVSYRFLEPSEDATTALVDEELIAGGSELAPANGVYRAEDRIWIVTGDGSWVVLSPSGGQQLAGAGSGASEVRFAGTQQGVLVEYATDGQLIVANADAPGSPIFSIPYSGVDFDMAPGGQEIVVSTGSAIEIYDIGGTLITSYATDGVQPGTVLWLNGGIVYHDGASGTLMQIPETAR